MTNLRDLAIEFVFSLDKYKGVNAHARESYLQGHKDARDLVERLEKAFESVRLTGIKENPLFHIQNPLKGGLLGNKSVDMSKLKEEPYGLTVETFKFYGPDANIAAEDRENGLKQHYAGDPNIEIKRLPAVGNLPALVHVIHASTKV